MRSFQGTDFGSAYRAIKRKKKKKKKKKKTFAHVYKNMKQDKAV